MAVTLMTVSAYARHRGCDEKAVRKAIAEERITSIERDGKRCIDPEVADIQWAKNTRARVRPGAAPPPAEDRTAPPAGGAEGLLMDGGTLSIDDVSYTEATRLLRIEDAKLARLERLKEEGALTDAEAVGRAIWTAFRTLRDSAMPLGRRVAGRVAPMTDSREIQLLIDAEMRLVLNAFRDRVLASITAEHAAPSTATAPTDVLS